MIFMIFTWSILLFLSLDQFYQVLWFHCAECYSSCLGVVSYRLFPASVLVNLSAHTIPASSLAIAFQSKCVKVNDNKCGLLIKFLHWWLLSTRFGIVVDKLLLLKLIMKLWRCLYADMVTVLLTVVTTLQWPCFEMLRPDVGPCLVIPTFLSSLVMQSS